MYCFSTILHTGNVVQRFKSLLSFVSCRLAWFKWEMRLCLSSLFARSLNPSPVGNTKSSDKNVLLTKRPGSHAAAQNTAKSSKVSDLLRCVFFSVFNRDLYTMEYYYFIFVTTVFSFPSSVNVASLVPLIMEGNWASYKPRFLFEGNSVSQPVYLYWYPMLRFL